MILRKFSILIFNIFLLSCQGQIKTDVYECNIEFVEIIAEHDYDNINEKWLKKDVEFYKELREVCKLFPEKLNELISAEHIKKIDLGNDYFIKSGSHGLGYLSVFYNFVYKNDKMIAYELKIPLEDILLLEKYELEPKEIFIESEVSNTNIADYLFYFGLENVYKPFNEIYSKKNVNSKINFYMTPFSGIDYGCRGGYGNGILKNRCAFKQIIYKHDLVYEDLIYILHSINIVSRLTAIEYYTNHDEKFNKKEQKEIENIIAGIFTEYGDTKIQVFDEDMAYYLSIEDAINKQLESDCY